ncbi:hypothetical protein VitviT2T_010546 [Vitis vinifera]|uniref:Polygalacturonase n=2 Tax=Vitis vinifera TaxID=29760 RepID=F6H7W0_VITVI|nr:polygalacturonase [Vitis vinifera]RVX23821.1 Polygalacturonase [Vitis vinifera]WJZ91479.1 hypothetical protein VitviT2T_010546 [Vitis vinifera]|eukprot:XP_010646462.1 PREDICTED: polygalacturonase [Vitis vinifera]
MGRLLDISYFLSLFFILIIIILNPSSSATQVYDVKSFGAKPDGLSDSTKAFLNAWAAACASTASSIIFVPKGRYLLHPAVFSGRYCTSARITILINGTLVAPADYRILGKANNWLSFEGVSGVSILGGAFDAKGPALWACKAAGNQHCPSGATTLSFTNSNNIMIKGMLSLNSQMFHIVINGCSNVRLQGVNIIASGNSPNTDGIHVQRSTNIAIIRSTIRTGDDCISIGPGTKNLWMEGIECGPGHGISIGSLAKDLEEEGVQNVTVKNAAFTGTQNGLRIKSWARASTGFVKGVHFEGVTMDNVQSPIVIDQNYCPHNQGCPSQESGVKVSDVTYKGIRGTSATKVAVKFDCSAANPCTSLRLEDVKLTYTNEDQVAQASCSNANGKAYGLVQPNSCL